MLETMEKTHNGIGTLGEKDLHALLKRHYEPDISKHEQKVGSYVADILNNQGIIEIQTRQLHKLRPKLTAFLVEHNVIVVYPIVANKTLAWIDPETGEVTKTRRSPKRGQLIDAARELYALKMFLLEKKLVIHLHFVDVHETRWLNGWSEDRKKGSHRANQEPQLIKECIVLNEPNDYRQFIPTDLEELFTSKDLAQLLKAPLHKVQTLINVLQHVGVIQKVDKQGRLNIYKRIE